MPAWLGWLANFARLKSGLTGVAYFERHPPNLSLGAFGESHIGSTVSCGRTVLRRKLHNARLQAFFDSEG